ncbi:MAG: nucleotide sugar dehydrogenase [Deltaproteobacteria bacterium]|nr:nucleotide sugar dehydrogenase [Deltaproteobacteria bacterium]
MQSERICIIGLGYVGLPVALAFARAFDEVVGVDIDARRVRELEEGFDRTNEVTAEELKKTGLRLTTDISEAGQPTMIVVTVPTPIDDNRQPDLRPLVSATRSAAPLVRKGTVLVYESTVYPGLTEEVCGPLVESLTGLKSGEDFFLGYSPERINPGDRDHTLERTVKVVAGQDPRTLDRIAEAYGKIIDAGVFRAASIRVAEAAKVIENTQRDLNIALMNELALIFDRLGIRTADVLEAAGTKWNFLPFRPGLVGGHCIGVDPYYLTAKAENVGYHPQVILAGRRINDNMGAFVAQRLIKMLISRDRPVKGARVGVFGLTFKENVPDLRNSRVPDILRELQEFGIEALVHDPRADRDEAMHEYGVSLCELEDMTNLDAMVLAVGHREYLELDRPTFLARVRDGGSVVDVKSVLDPASIPDNLEYWSL